MGREAARTWGISAAVAAAAAAAVAQPPAAASAASSGSSAISTCETISNEVQACCFDGLGFDFSIWDRDLLRYNTVSLQMMQCTGNGADLPHNTVAAVLMAVHSTTSQCGTFVHT